MNTKDVIKYAITSSQQIVSNFLSDLSDADLLVRAAPTANHIAWQLGHLIGSEASYFLAKLPGAPTVELPAGFAEQHSNTTAQQNPPTGFLTKAQYLELFNKVRGVTLAALDKLTDADLDQPTGWDMAPTIGKVLVMISTHDMMHAGQFSVVRRILGKPVLF